MWALNRIFVVDSAGNKKRVFFIPGVVISFKGKNSEVVFHKPLPKFKYCKFVCGDNCYIEIGSSNYLIKKLRILVQGDNSICKIGDNFSLVNTCEIVARPASNTSVEIGNDCMFASRILIRSQDGHIVRDLATHNILNPSKNVKIGNHVWIANDVTILKGVNIQDNTAIGLGAILTQGEYLSNSVYAGVPAKLVKSNVTWERESP